QPSHEWVDVLAGQKPAARRVGAHLKLEGDAHRRGLVHTGQHRTWAGRPRHGGTVGFFPAARWFYRPPAAAAFSGAAVRSRAGSGFWGWGCPRGAGRWAG